MSYASPVTVEGPVQVTEGAVERDPAPYRPNTDVSVDLFGSAYVTNKITQFDSRMVHGIDPNAYDIAEENGATVTYVPGLSGAQMALNSQAGGRAMIQSSQYGFYLPGNEIGGQGTFGNVNLVAGDEFRTGYFDDDEGPYLAYYFFQGNLTCDLVLRSNITGTPVEERINKDGLDGNGGWNIDRLDGTGNSKLEMNLLGRQIVTIKAEWLSVGDVRITLTIGGQNIPIHQFHHSNTPGAAYIESADKPYRWELIGPGNSSIVAECCAIQTTGTGASPTLFGDEAKAFIPSITTSYGASPQPSVNPTALIAIRPRPQSAVGKDNHVIINVDEYLISPSGGRLYVEAWYNAISNPDSLTWNNTHSDCFVQYCDTGITLDATNGVPNNGRALGAGTVAISGGGGSNAYSSAQGSKITGKEPFTLHYDGRLDNIVLVAWTLDGNVSNTMAVIAWDHSR